MPDERPAADARRFWVRAIVGATVIAAALAAYPLAVAAAPARNGVLFGWAMSFALCVASGFIAFGALDRSMRGFLVAVFGGMLGRMVAIGAAVVVAVVVLRVSVLPFVAGLLGSYAIYQGIEIVALSRGGSRESPAGRLPRERVD